MLLNPNENDYQSSNRDSDKENFIPNVNQSVFQWVNSLPYLNCSVANEIDDFRNGLIFCELINELSIKNGQNPDFLEKIESNDLSYSNCIYNLKLALNILKNFKELAPEYVTNITAEELFENDQKIIILLVFLYNELTQNPLKSKSNISNKGKPPLKPVQKSIDQSENNQKISYTVLKPPCNSIFDNEKTIENSKSLPPKPENQPIEARNKINLYTIKKEEKSLEKSAKSLEKLDFDIKKIEYSDKNTNSTPLYFVGKSNLTIASDNARKSIKTFENLNRSNNSKLNLSTIQSQNQKSNSVDLKPPQIPEKTKEKIIFWLISIGLIKENINQLSEKLPKICKNGVIFSDLINRLESRQNPNAIKGIHRKPSNISYIRSNYMKIFEFLNKFEKFNKRFLFCFDLFSEPNLNAFWGLLDDIWYFYQGKISPFDLRYINDNEKKSIKSEYASIKKTEFTNTTYDDICFSVKKKNYKEENNTFYKFSPIPMEKKIENFDKNDFSEQKTYKSLFEPLKVDSKQIRPLPQPQNPSISLEIKEKTITSLEKLGLSNYLPLKSLKIPIHENPIKNGLFFSLLLEKLKISKISNLKRVPQSVKDCKDNLDLIFQEIRRKKLEIPYEYIWKIDEIINGDENIIYNLVWNLLKNEQNNTFRSNSLNKSNNSIKENSQTLIRNDSSRYLLRNYQDQDLVQKEKNIYKWLKKLNLYQYFNEKTIDFNDLIPYITNGLLLCDLSSKLTNNNIVGVNRKPISEASKKSNIQKAYELLKQFNLISVNLSNSQEEIYKGNYIVIVNLFDYIKNICLKNKNLESERNIFDNKDEKIQNLSFDYVKNSDLIANYNSNKKKKISDTGPIMKKIENNEIKSLNKEQSIKKWLENLNFGNFAQNIDFSKENQILKDGIFLAKLIEKLENKEISGINLKPKTAAAQKGNIRKILEFLKFKNEMNLKYLYNNDGLLEGNGACFLEFLEHIKYVYRHTGKFLLKKK